MKRGQSGEVIQQLITQYWEMQHGDQIVYQSKHGHLSAWWVKGKCRTIYDKRLDGVK